MKDSSLSLFGFCLPVPGRNDIDGAECYWVDPPHDEVVRKLAMSKDIDGATEVARRFGRPWHKESTRPRPGYVRAGRGKIRAQPIRYAAEDAAHRVLASPYVAVLR